MNNSVALNGPFLKGRRSEFRLLIEMMRWELKERKMRKLKLMVATKNDFK